MAGEDEGAFGVSRRTLRHVVVASLIGAGVVLPSRVQAESGPAREGPSRLSAESDLAAAFRTEVGDRVFFPEISADLGGRARVALKAQAVWLMRHPTTRVQIQGHADDSADAASDERLSLARAEAVRNHLIAFGVAAERIEVRALGRLEPVAVCPDRGCAAHNRRAVTQVLGGGAAATEGTLVVRDRPSPRRLF